MIEVTELTKRFGRVTAVDGLTFTVRPGRVTGFLGPNGSGKSTTLRAILGLEAPDRGTALVGGLPYRDLRHPLHQVGALLDAGAVHPGRSARAHLMALAVAGRVGRRRVGEVLEQVGLGQVADQRAGGFSLGMRQRLGIAAALLGDPPVVMFDEPVNGLDPEGIRWVRQLMKSLAAEGRTVLVSSHLMSEMALTADHLVVIGRGRLIADTGVKAFLAEHGTGQVQVRSPARGSLAGVLREHGAGVEYQGSQELLVTGLTVDRIGDLAARNGLPVHELAARQASLEDVFMNLTRDSVEYQGMCDGN
ncbi:ABC transporter ATP-binding protein [Streptomyces orinoci]|uniref:ATP-binding cassette domain-containing protein n=1 Tax=Streptomyces orinoci TaxID=67339 RepID=A0ABV3JTL0_STRON|nr:ATP-binding cassette domain-containing protein [Streptomyces orinoci]